MVTSAHTHSRSHSLLLFQKLLNLRDSASPLTLVLDSLEQSAAPLIREYIARARISKAKVIFLSCASLKKPKDADVFIKARGKSLKALRSEILSHYPKPDAATAATHKGKAAGQRTLILIDSLNELATSSPHVLPNFLSSIVSPTASAIAVYHTDVPLVLPRTVSEYEPHPFTVLCHLATAILRLSSLRQEIERQKARNRSLQEPEWGLDEGREGVLVGMKGETRSEEYRGAVVDMELRRRSGRAVTEKFILLPGGSSSSSSSSSTPTGAQKGPGAVRTESRVSLLSDHPVFASPDDTGGDAAGGAAPAGAAGGGGEEADQGPASTFNLGLTDKQRKDREGIVLPYFDAQTDIGSGEGGRILYEMGREDQDDFDDEEDEEI